MNETTDFNFQKKSRESFRTKNKKEKRERGSPCLMPLEDLNKPKGNPSKRMKKEMDPFGVKTK